MPTPATHAAKLAALAAAVAGVSSAVTVAVQRGSSTPGTGGAAAYPVCVQAQEVYYVQHGDTVFYVPPLGSALLDSLARADSTPNPSTPYATLIEVCAHAPTLLHAVLKD